MKVTAFLFGQVIRTMKVSEPEGRRIYGGRLAKACEERYGFLQGPRTVEEFDGAKGITFRHGYFENRLVIDRFQVFNNGLLAEAKSSTDDVDLFLDDVMKWVAGKSGIVFDLSESRRFYGSQIEVEMDAGLQEGFAKYRSFGHQIANALRSYGHIVPDLNVHSFALASDAATTFKVEQREGTIAEARKYFCAAPLRTIDHTHLLGQLEDLFRA